MWRLIILYRSYSTDGRLRYDNNGNPVEKRVDKTYEGDFSLAKTFVTLSADFTEARTAYLDNEDPESDYPISSYRIEIQDDRCKRFIPMRLAKKVVAHLSEEEASRAKMNLLISSTQSPEYAIQLEKYLLTHDKYDEYYTTTEGLGCYDD